MKGEKKRMPTVPNLILPTWSEELPSSWPWKRLWDVCEDIIDCPHSTPEVVEFGPFLMARTSDILSGIFRTEEARRVSEDTYNERVRRAEPQFGDLLYSREGTYFGLSAEVPANTKVCLGQRMVLLRPKQGIVDNKYLRYWLNSTPIQGYLHGHRDGSVAERLNLPTIRALPVCLPPLPEQRAIAHILGTLDDKIELNRKMNQTLEEMARTIFKSWFVDFDPVRAKAAGKKPAGMDEATAALFPDGFEDSELGEIPRGWKVQPLDEIVEILSGGTPKRSEPSYWEGEIPWFSVKDAPPESDLFVLWTDESITEVGVEHSATQVLPEGTTIVTARGTVGKLALVGKPMAMNQSCYGIRGKKGYPDLFNYFNLKQTVTSLRQQTHGSVFDTITKDTFKSVKVVVPVVTLASSFAKIVASMVHKIQSNLVESRISASLRNALLPRLLSGELRIKDVERVVGALA